MILTEWARQNIPAKMPRPCATTRVIKKLSKSERSPRKPAKSAARLVHAALFPVSGAFFQAREKFYVARIEQQKDGNFC